MASQRKRLFWCGNSLDCVKEFSLDARKVTGFELDRIQLGKEPSDWKPMSGIGPGAKEIRIWAEKSYRVIYVAKFRDEVFVLHAFEKKTRKTSKSDIELARQRYQKLLTVHKALK